MAMNAALFSFPTGMTSNFDPETLPPTAPTTGDATDDMALDNSIARIFTYTGMHRDWYYPTADPESLTIDWTRAQDFSSLTTLLFGAALRNTDELENFTVSERAQYNSLRPLQGGDFGTGTFDMSTEVHLRLCGYTLFYCATSTQMANFVRDKTLRTTEGNLNFSYTARSSYLFSLKTLYNLRAGALPDFRATDNFYLLAFRPALHKMATGLADGTNYVWNRHYLDYSKVHTEQTYTFNSDELAGIRLFTFDAFTAGDALRLFETECDGTDFALHDYLPLTPELDGLVTAAHTTNTPTNIVVLTEVTEGTGMN